MKILVLVLLMLGLAGCDFPIQQNLPSLVPTATATAAEGVSVSETLVSGSETRHYLVHIPPGYATGTPLPLVLNFHGWGSNSWEQETLTGMSMLADAEGFLVVYPDGLEQHWNSYPGMDLQTDEQFVRDLLIIIEGEYSVDTKRIYATGFSNGGGMANHLACDMADIFAAVASNAGAYYTLLECHPARPLPILAFHGFDDRVVPYNGAPRSTSIPLWAVDWARRNGCNVTPLETEPVATVNLQTWSGCDGGAVVELYSLRNHGHSWPGSPIARPGGASLAINATEVMWDFFKAHPLP